MVCVPGQMVHTSEKLHFYLKIEKVIPGPLLELSPPVCTHRGVY